MCLKLKRKSNGKCRLGEKFIDCIGPPLGIEPTPLRSRLKDTYTEKVSCISISVVVVENVLIMVLRVTSQEGFVRQSFAATN